MSFRQIVLFFTYLQVVNVGAQTIVFKDSEDLMEFMSAVPWDDNSFEEAYFYYYQFKEKLPDGIYYYVDMHVKDSVKALKNIENVYAIKAVYKDSIRNGKYLEYVMSSYKLGIFTKRKRALFVKSFFKDGKLHGLFKYQNVLGQVEYEGNYKHGMKHGFFYEYDPEGRLIKVQVYEEGELKYVSGYRDPTIFAPICERDEGEQDNSTNKILMHKSDDPPK